MIITWYYITDSAIHTSDLESLSSAEGAERRESPLLRLFSTARSMRGVFARDPLRPLVCGVRYLE